MKRYEFTEAMNEVSGFGGDYERCCRAAVCAGAQWFAAHRQARPEFSGFDGVFGLITPVNEEAKALVRHIEAAQFAHDDGTKARVGDEMTGAIFHATIHHVFFIAQQGWRAYVQKMSAPLAIVADENAEEENA